MPCFTVVVAVLRCAVRAYAVPVLCQVDVGADGTVYVADGYCNSRIIKFAADGAYLGESSTARMAWQFRDVHRYIISFCVAVPLHRCTAIEYCCGMFAYADIQRSVGPGLPGVVIPYWRGRST